MQKRCIYSTLILLLFSFDKSVASPQVDVRFLFTSKFNFRSDTTFVPKFEYQLAIPQFPPAPYVALYQSPPLATVPTQTPDTLTSTLIVPHIFENEGIEQYPGERAYKRQRKLSSRRLAGYGSATAGKPLSYSLGPDVRGSWEPTHTQILEASLADEDDRHYEKPRYRYTQVGISYGRQADYHHKDGGYGPYDPHGTREYAIATGSYRADRRH